MNDDKIIRFPGSGPGPAKPGKAAKGEAASKEKGKGETARGVDGLTEDQRKAVQIVLSGMPFVLIGIQPTASGADFFTALGGEAGDLRNAQDHLAGVIERAFAKRGLST
ncbi:MAG: hypothetical protein H0X38_16445 [Planctomycetes bacterium]|nr:hypothetical protein [Planctomycetota bacterium]